MNKLFTKHKHKKSHSEALQRFIKFLITEVPALIFPEDVNRSFRHTAYDRFASNLIDSIGGTNRAIDTYGANSVFNWLLSRAKPYEFVSIAFTWCTTNEGYVFWSTISKAWINVVEKEKL